MPDTKNYVLGENKSLREGYTKTETENMIIQQLNNKIIFSETEPEAVIEGALLLIPSEDGE